MIDCLNLLTGLSTLVCLHTTTPFLFGISLRNSPKFPSYTNRIAGGSRWPARCIIREGGPQALAAAEQARRRLGGDRSSADHGWYAADCQSITPMP